MLVVATALSLLVGDIETPSLAVLPDLRGVSSGVDAIASDPSGTAWADGFAVQLRHLNRPGQNRRRGDYGGYALLPIGPLRASLGHERFVRGTTFRRWTLGLATQIDDNMVVGFSWRRVSEANGPRTAGVWDLSMGIRPHPIASLSFGVDALNRPTFGSEKFSRAVKFGGGIRPILGSSLVTLGGELRYFTDFDDNVLDGRATIDVGTSGVHASAAYSVRDERLWVGLSFQLGGIGLRTGVEDVVDDFGARTFNGALTLGPAPAESMLPTVTRRVVVGVRGDLKDAYEGWFAPRASVPTLAWRLYRAAAEHRAQEWVLRIGRVEAGFASIEELRDVILFARSRGIRVVAELLDADERALMLATACDEIRVDPIGTLELDGFAVVSNYFADTLDKVGVRFDSVEIGKYKSAPDTLTRNNARPEAREVRSEILDHIFDRFKRALIESGRADENKIEAWLERGFLTGKQAESEGLVNGFTVSPDPKDIAALPVEGASIYDPAPARTGWGPLPTIQILAVQGMIVGDNTFSVLSSEQTGAAPFIREVERARLDPNVDGVVLRIDSPGGDVIASELMWRAVRRLARDKPVAVSMGDIAASGGYYIAMGGQRVFAQPSTITGSIGIFTLKPDLSALFEKIGLVQETQKRGEHADWSSLGHELRTEDRGRIQARLDAYYQDFLTRVAINRGMELEAVDEVAQGRVYMGQRAHELGLVDELGGLPEAVAWVLGEAGLDGRDPYRVRFPEGGGKLSALVSNVAQAPAAFDVDRLLEMVRSLRDIEARPMALMPLQVVVR